VIDPGVGTSRLPIVVDCERGILIGPDNGLLAGASDVLGLRAAYKITNPEFMTGTISSTFHGRDVFAQTAAMLSEGRKPTAVGVRIDKLIQLDLPSVDVSPEHISCHVVYIDSFGNLVTDVAMNNMQEFEKRRGKTAQLVVKGRELDCLFVNAYSEIPQGEVGMLFGSQGHLEVSLREASAAARFHARLGDLVEIGFR
ncbi:MAG TPA: SAM-dependent chlorinase/fluorinase, partial [Candidatus Bathyarchaeia archaeon]|nr:SAM-dependent chlorinase/fluorinase [Candidatus Bathyarchaeia archaeon]